MKLLVSITLWTTALIFAAWVAYRLIRGKPMLLHGRVGRRAIRIAAVVLVGLGLHRTHATAQPETSGQPDHPEVAGQPSEMQEVPEALLALAEDVRLLLLQEQRELSNVHKKSVATALEQSPSLRLVLEHRNRHMDSDEGAPRIDVHTIYRAASEIQSHAALFSEPLNTLLWHELQALPAPRENEAELYAAALRGIQENARMLNTLIRARAQAGVQLRANPRAWQSKAGPRPDDFQVTQEDSDAFVDAVARLYPTSDTGLWGQEGRVMISVDANGGVLELIRRGHISLLEPGMNCLIGRLDLLRAGDEDVELRSDWLGVIRLPANQTFRTADLPVLLEDAARQHIEEAIVLALNGDDQAMLQLERHMPWCLPQVLEMIRADESQQAAGLRLLVYLYDPYLLDTQMWDHFERQVNDRHNGAGWQNGGVADQSRDIP